MNDRYFQDIPFRSIESLKELTLYGSEDLLRFFVRGDGLRNHPNLGRINFRERGLGYPPFWCSFPKLRWLQANMNQLPLEHEFRWDHLKTEELFMDHLDEQSLHDLNRLSIIAPNLKELELIWFDTQDLIAGLALAPFYHLETLKLRPTLEIGNNMLPQTLLAACPALKNFDIELVGILDEGMMEALARHATLESLRVQYINGEHTERILRTVQENHNFKTLDLYWDSADGMAELEVDVIDAFRHQLTSNASNLTTLKLSYPCESMVALLAEVVGHENFKLERLQFDDCRDGSSLEPTRLLLARSLLNNRTITELELVLGMSPKETLDALLRLISHNACLKKLDVTYSGDKDFPLNVDDFAAALQKNTTLLHANLGWDLDKETNYQLYFICRHFTRRNRILHIQQDDDDLAKGAWPTMLASAAHNPSFLFLAFRSMYEGGILDHLMMPA